MKAESKSVLTGNTTMLLLSLLEKKDMYGYEMIEALAQKSNYVFQLKAGTLYPLLHTLCEQGILNAYEQIAENTRIRKYYTITSKGKKLLSEKEQEWRIFQKAVENILTGGMNVAELGK